MSIFRSLSNRVIRMGIMMFAIGWLAGCDGAAKSAETSSASGYVTGSGGLVTEIGPEFFESTKTVYLDDDGKRIDGMWFRVSGGEMRVMGRNGVGAGGPVSEEKLRDGVGKGIATGGQGGYVRFYSICVSEVAVRSGVNSEGGPIDARTPYFQIATKDGGSSSIVRARFTVEQ